MYPLLHLAPTEIFFQIPYNSPPRISHLSQSVVPPHPPPAPIDPPAPLHCGSALSPYQLPPQKPPSLTEPSHLILCLRVPPPLLPIPTPLLPVSLPPLPLT